ncbi:hypothetical protein BAE44_0017990 [Dichanthelium oligosanthes]|uniref:FBD domain-containing protein n=1 Tax=Dichanthelium oligosanthes TaxID=888268 RepID=A0A1E5V757_9POAL|nr:hypothetical protein BAE44_0017990 [Dichanthelium oligosanthes]
MPCLDIDQREFDASASRARGDRVAWECGSPAEMEISWPSHAIFSGLPHSGSTACRLKRLRLAGIALDTGFAQRLRSGCPVLEDLQLERSPALASFHLAMTTPGINWSGIIVNEMPSLVKASIHLESPVASCELLCSLVNVQKLELSGSKTMSILRNGSDAFPTFCNLRTLLFAGCNLNDDFKILECFLTNAPTLEKLTLHYCKVIFVFLGPPYVSYS